MNKTGMVPRPQSLLSEGMRGNINKQILLCGKYLIEQNLSTKWTPFLLSGKKSPNDVVCLHFCLYYWDTWTLLNVQVQ